MLRALDGVRYGLREILNDIGGAVGIARENPVSTEMSNAKAWN
ncbi:MULTISPECIES: hypothetical protein [unclassified Micromonospora]